MNASLDRLGIVGLGRWAGKLDASKIREFMTDPLENSETKTG